MEINDVVEKIIERLKNEEYYSTNINGKLSIISKYQKNEESLCRVILKEELFNFISILNKDAIQYKNKCEIYETLISNSNFKMAIEKINNRKKKEVEKDE